MKSRSSLPGAVVFVFSLVATCGAQSPSVADSEASGPFAVVLEPVIALLPVNLVPVATPPKAGRLMGIIPDFQTVRDPEVARQDGGAAAFNASGVLGTAADLSAI